MMYLNWCLRYQTIDYDSKHHCMDLPSARRRLKANFSGVIAFHFSIDVAANTVFGGHETKKLIRT